MGAGGAVKPGRRVREPGASRGVPPPLPYPLPPLPRSRPRGFEEWAALRRWGRLPEAERAVVGYLLRAARESSGLTQAALAARLGCTQQAVSRAERWSSNPTVGFVRAWLENLGWRLELDALPSREEV
jgi:DNA-binding XRE family transcriptional regulator